jgi:peptidoglycan hydrolase CwlO-like protein
MDLTQMSERDLLISLLSKVENIETRMSAFNESIGEHYREINRMKVDIAKLQTEIKIYSAIAAAVGSIIATVATNIFK